MGGLAASERPIIVRTILGSCISVCLRDPFTGVGGMNHFMLPSGSGDFGNPARYGVHAMELLINQCMKLGASRSHLEAKVFGGGNVLNVKRASFVNVAKQNIEFARSFLRTENIPVVAHNVGGLAAREVYFFTDSGRVFMRKFRDTGFDEDLAIQTQPTPPAAPADDDNVTLF